MELQKALKILSSNEKGQVKWCSSVFESITEQKSDISSIAAVAWVCCASSIWHWSPSWLLNGRCKLAHTYTLQSFTLLLISLLNSQRCPIYCSDWMLLNKVAGKLLMVFVVLFLQAQTFILINQYMLYLAKACACFLPDKHQMFSDLFA